MAPARRLMSRSKVWFWLHNKFNEAPFSVFLCLPRILSKINYTIF